MGSTRTSRSPLSVVRSRWTASGRRRSAISMAPARSRCSGWAMDRATSSRASRAMARMMAMAMASRRASRWAAPLRSWLVSVTPASSWVSTERRLSISVVLAASHCWALMSSPPPWLLRASCSIRLTVRVAAPWTSWANSFRWASLALVWNCAKAARCWASRLEKSWNPRKANPPPRALAYSEPRTWEVSSLARERSSKARTCWDRSSSPPGSAISPLTSSSRWISWEYSPKAARAVIDWAVTASRRPVRSSRPARTASKRPSSLGPRSSWSGVLGGPVGRLGAVDQALLGDQGVLHVLVAGRAAGQGSRRSGRARTGARGPGR